MITRLTVRCWHCDVERVYPIPGDFSDVIIEMEIYHSVCGRKMDYWTEEVDLIMWNSGTAKGSRTSGIPGW